MNLNWAKKKWLAVPAANHSTIPILECLGRDLLRKVTP